MQSSDSKCGDVVYDGTKKGEHIHHSIYQFTVVETGETWTGPMPVVQGAPINCKVTIGYRATEHLVKVVGGWAIQSVP